MKDYIDFQLHDKLNPKLWQDDMLKPDVRKKLLKIAKAFHDFLKVDAKLKDVLIVGSSANYNYSDNYSDIDLHLVYDFEDIVQEDDDKISSQDDLIKEYMLAKKTIWNDSFDITIKDIEVELYAQDVNEETEANGQFSIAKNEWIKKPSTDYPDIDADTAEKKANDIMNLIDHALKNNVSAKTLDTLKKKIKKLRQSGLESGGEYSPENLAFKILRRSDYIQKLWDAEEKMTEKELSL